MINRITKLSFQTPDLEFYIFTSENNPGVGKKIESISHDQKLVRLRHRSSQGQMKIIKRQSEVTSGQIFSKTLAYFFQGQLGTIVNPLKMIIFGKRDRI